MTNFEKTAEIWGIEAERKEHAMAYNCALKPNIEWCSKQMSPKSGSYEIR